MSKRGIAEVIRDWRSSAVNDDDGELASRINYFLATTPDDRWLLERIRNIVSMCERCHDYQTAVLMIRRFFEEHGYPIHHPLSRNPRDQREEKANPPQ